MRFFPSSLLYSLIAVKSNEGVPLHYITRIKPHAPRFRRTRMITIAVPITTATTCSPHITTMRLSGAPVINAIKGRSVGAGRGAGGVKREAETLVGKTAAMD